MALLGVQRFGQQLGWQICWRASATKRSPLALDPLHHRSEVGLVFGIDQLQRSRQEFGFAGRLESQINKLGKQSRPAFSSNDAVGLGKCRHDVDFVELLEADKTAINSINERAMATGNLLFLRLVKLKAQLKA